MEKKNKLQKKIVSPLAWGIWALYTHVLYRHAIHETEAIWSWSVQPTSGYFSIPSGHTNWGAISHSQTWKL